MHVVPCKMVDAKLTYGCLKLSHDELERFFLCVPFAVTSLKMVFEDIWLGGRTAFSVFSMRN